MILQLTWIYITRGHNSWMISYKKNERVQWNCWGEDGGGKGANSNKEHCLYTPRIYGQRYKGILIRF